MVSRWAHNPQILGSIPSTATKFYWGVAQLVEPAAVNRTVRGSSPLAPARGKFMLPTCDQCEQEFETDHKLSLHKINMKHWDRKPTGSWSGSMFEAEIHRPRKTKPPVELLPCTCFTAEVCDPHEGNAW